MHYEIIAVSGLDRVGKSTLGKYLASDSCQIFECGEYVKNRMDLEGLDNTSVSDCYERNMQNFNRDIIEQIRSNLDRASECKCVVAVGVRSIKLLESILALGFNVFTIYVQSEFIKRYSRFVGSVDSKIGCNEQQFVNNDNRQYSWGLEKIRLLANIVIDNNGSIEDFVISIEQIRARIC